MNTSSTSASGQAYASEFANKIDLAIKRCESTSHPFAVLLIQVANMGGFRAQRPTHVVQALLRELHAAIRKAVHQDQFVGIFQDGVGLVLETNDVGNIDIVARKLVTLAQH